MKDYGITVLRLTMAVILLSHSVLLKFLTLGLPGSAQYFVSIGLHPVLAYVTFVVEVMVGIALIFGYKTRFFALLATPFMVGATWVHYPNGWLFSNQNGGWEFPAMLVVLLFVLMMTGGGALSVSQDRRRR